MKKITVTLFSLMLIFLTSCSSDKKEIKTTIIPSEILSISEIAPYVGYTPVVATEKNSRRKSFVTYVSEPIGEFDSVTVRISQKNDLQSAEKIKADFDKSKSMRSDVIDVAELNCEAYIIFPSIHYYIEGYHVEITAGSGANEHQKTLLINLADTSLNNLRELTGILSEN